MAAQTRQAAVLTGKAIAVVFGKAIGGPLPFRANALRIATPDRRCAFEYLKGRVPSTGVPDAVTLERYAEALGEPLLRPAQREADLTNVTNGHVQHIAMRAAKSEVHVSRGERRDADALAKR
jgi:hypothetical protein